MTYDIHFEPEELDEEDARKHGFKQIIWDSVSPDLIKFTERFGYRTSPNEVVKDL